MVLYPTRGVSELGRIDPDAVMARYGLTPAQYPDFAALRGDPSDNLPNIPGVGEKTAAKWVREFGSLAELTDRVDEVKGKAGDALRAHLANVLLNRQLTELVRDVPLDATPAELAVRPWDREAVHRLFDELEFRVLRERLFATLQSAEPEAEGGIEVQGGALEPGAVRAWLAAHARDGRRVGLSFGGITGGVTTGDLAGIGLACGEPSVEARAAGAAAGVPRGGLRRAERAHPGRRGGPRRVAGRPGRAQGRARRQVGAARAARPRLDAARADQRHRAGRLPVPARAAQLRPGRPGAAAPAPRAAASTARPTAGSCPCSAVRRRPTRPGPTPRWCAASAVGELADALDAELAERGGSELLAEVELPLQGVLADLETAGIAVDHDALAALEAEFAAQVKQAAQDAYAVIGKEINLGSPKQLQVVLFDELGMPKTKRTKTGYTTDADALQTLFEQTGHEFLQHLLVHRDATRLKITVEGLLKSVADDGRIHTTYSQTIAATGRLVLHRAQPAERADPHRGRAGGSGRTSSSARLRRADDRRLQPDRDADHGAPVRGRGADRGVPVPARLPRRDRGPRVRGRCRPRSPRRSGPRSRR